MYQIYVSPIKKYQLFQKLIPNLIYIKLYWTLFIDKREKEFIHWILISKVMKPKSSVRSLV